MNKRTQKLISSLPDNSAVFINGYANIFYYSNFTSEDAWLLLTYEKQYIITDSRYFLQARLECPDFELVDIKMGWKEIFKLVPEEEIYFEEEHISYRQFASLSEYTNKHFIPGQNKIDFPRRRKDNDEIEIIRQAEEIGDRAFSYVLGKLRVGMTERDVACELEMQMRKLGADKTSFDTIAASGVRSAMPHGTATDKVIEKGDFLTLDFGCIYKGYCSDMTRTVVFGEADSKQKEIYDLVLKAQTETISKLREGMKCSVADKIARDIISDGGYGDKFTHSLGHSVGVEIHENPSFSPKSDDNLEKGMVLSVEPGIYIDGWGGVRIEDLIAVTDEGIINLTHSPKELIVI